MPAASRDAHPLPSERAAAERREGSGSGSGSGALKITALVTHSAVCCPRQQPRKRLGALSSNTRYFLSSSFSLATSRTVTQPQRRQEDAGRGAAAAAFFFFFFAPSCCSYPSIPFGSRFGVKHLEPSQGLIKGRTEEGR